MSLYVNSFSEAGAARPWRRCGWRRRNGSVRDAGLVEKVFDGLCDCGRLVDEPEIDHLLRIILPRDKKFRALLLRSSGTREVRFEWVTTS